jgi:hypothetical protein
LKISHSHSTKATFEMPHKFQKKLKKSEIFIASTCAIFASTLKISAVCMQVLGAYGLALGR